MKPGEIYHLDHVEPLRGKQIKGRYVVVVTGSSNMVPDQPIYVVACTSSATVGQIESGQAIELPWNRQRMANTGFRKPTCAIPAWMLRVRPSQLGRRIGIVPATKLAQIIARLPPDASSDLS